MAEPQLLDDQAQAPAPQEVVSPQQDGGVVIGLPGAAGDGLPLPTLPQPLATPNEPSKPTVDKRTFKINYSGLANLIGQSEEGVRSSIAAGQEDWIRKEAAAKIDFNNAQEQHKKIVAASISRGGPLDPKEVATILDPYNPANRPADPLEVLERAYATTYVSSANTAAGFMQDNFLDKAKGEIPEQVDGTEAKTTDLATIREFVHTKAENLQDEISKQGWIGWTADQLALLAQPYSEYKLRGLMKEVGKLDGGVLLGTNLESTIDAIYSSPDPKGNITRILDGLKSNPSLALLFAHALLGTTTSDRYLNNIFTVLAPLDITAGVSLSRKLLTKVDLFNKLQRGYRDVAKSLEVEQPTQATIAESVGNTEKAATLRVTDNVMKANEGGLDPTQVAREALMTGFRQDAELLANNTGSFSREAVVRLQDNIIKGGETLLTEAEQMSKVQRTPLALSVEANVTALKKAEASNYRGPKNTYLDIGDPIPNNITNTHVWPVRYANYDNLLFSSEELADTFAKEQLKILDYRVVKTEGKVESEAAKYAGSTTDLAKKTRLEKSIPETEAALKRYRAVARDESKTEEVRAEARSHINGPDGIVAILKRDKDALTDVNTRVTTIPAVINQKGIGFYIERQIPFNEGQSLVKDLMIKDLEGNLVPDAVGTSSASGFENIRNGVFGWFRGANHTLSKNEMMQRNAATFSTSGLRRWAKEEGQALVDIAKGRVPFDEITGEPIPWYKSAPRPITGKLTNDEVREQFTRTLKFAQDATDPVTGEPGYFFKTLGELEQHYLTYYQRPPSFNEANAYTSFVKMVEAERTLMEISEYKYRSRLGVEQHQFWFRGPNGTKINSGFVDGVDRKSLPGGSENILVLGDRPGDERLYKTDRMPAKDRERWEQQVASGQGKVIQLYASGQRPLAEFSKVAGGERIVYVFANNVETKSLEYNHVNRRGGAHFDFDYDHAVKQPIITHAQPGSAASDKRGGGAAEALYEGDRTFALADNRAQGRDFARRMNEVVELMDAKKMDEAKAKFMDNKLPMEWEKFRGFFEPTKGPDGKTVLPRYSTKEKFEVVPKGKQIADLPSGKELEAKYEGIWRDGTRSGDLSKQFQVDYNVERAEDRVYAINARGRADRPDFEYQPASMIDPIASFDRSFKRMINSTFMDDYKIYTVEHWLREAAPYLKPRESEIRSAPFAHFVTPEWKSGLDSVDLMKKSNLLSNRYKAREFVGLPSKFDTMMYQLTQHIADEMYESANPFKRGALLVPHWLLPYHAEPVSAVRSLAYDFKLGLYAVPQIFTQFNSWTTTIALEPRHGSAGTFASLLHTWASVIPQHVDHLDMMATKLDTGRITAGSSRWRPGEFKEGRQELINSGFLNVGGEMADLDNVFNSSSVMAGSSKFREGGRKPFQWGEKAARIPAYYTAFRKFREANPFEPLSALDRQQILRDANILTNNMTRASNSILNEGIASLPMQFLSYTYRLGETFFGKEIGETVGERSLARVRLMATYGAMYGLPSAIGVTGLPLGDKARKYALDNFGYIPGEHWYSTALMEGWPALFLNKATGNTYDVGGKWGTKGMTTVSDLLRSDKSWMQIVGGAGIDNIYKFISGFDGWYKAMISFARQDPADKSFKLTFDDMIKPALQISSVNTFRKGYVGVTMGKWIATNDAPVMDVSKLNSVFMATTGLSPTKQSDSWLKGDIRKEEKSMQKDALKSFLEDMARADMAAKANDPTQSEVFKRNGFATLRLAGFTYERVLSAIALAARNKGNSIERSDYDFYLGRDVPQEKREGRKDTFVRSKQLQGNQ